MVLRSLVTMLSQCRSRAVLPDFLLVRSMLFYLDEFAEKRHHRKESELLFPKLRARTPLARDLLDGRDGDRCVARAVQLAVDGRLPRLALREDDGVRVHGVGSYSVDVGFFIRYMRGKNRFW